MSERFELTTALAPGNREVSAWLIRRQKGHTDLAFAGVVFAVAFAVAWLAETIARWQA